MTSSVPRKWVVGICGHKMTVDKEISSTEEDPCPSQGSTSEMTKAHLEPQQTPSNAGCRVQSCQYMWKPFPVQHRLPGGPFLTSDCLYMIVLGPILRYSETDTAFIQAAVRRCHIGKQILTLSSWSWLCRHKTCQSCGVTEAFPQISKQDLGAWSKDGRFCVHVDSL